MNFQAAVAVLVDDLSAYAGDTNTNSIKGPESCDRSCLMEDLYLNEFGNE